MDVKVEQEQQLPGASDPAMASLLAPAEKQTDEPQNNELEGNEHEPDENHPRFKKVYGKMKHLERQYEEMQSKLTAKDSDFQALVEHNKKLAESMKDLSGRVVEKPRPDPTEDPTGYDQWMMDKIKRDMNPSLVPDFDTGPVVKTVTGETAQQASARKLREQEEEMIELHEDYLFATQQVGKMMDSDYELQQKIMGAKNPALAAYTHYKKVKNKQDNLDRGSLGTGAGYEPSAAKKSALTPDEKQWARKLGVSEAQYAEQLAFTKR